VRYRILGNLAAHDGGHWHEIPGTKPRALLAALLIRCGDVLTVDQLLFEMWGDRPPRSAPTQIQGYVLRIRRMLGEAGARSLVTASPGYRLIVGDDELDSLVFTRTAKLGQAALRAGDAEHAAELLGDALAMWRGPVLADLPPSPLVSGIRRRLDELRHSAWEARVDADLALGRHAELVDEVARHVDAHPLRETPWRQLMLALDGAGRRDEALAAYESVRAILDDHSGIEPGAALRGLYDDLRRPRPHQVPTVLKLVGRAEELAVLDTLANTVSEPVVATVAGPAGIGKTALVRHWARTAIDRFPDGQLYVDLHGYTSGPPSQPSTVLAGFLRALDVPADEVPADEDARAALYRSRLAGRRVLVVLDNARDADQVRPLLPGPSSCVVLVTSRDDLRGLTATHGARLLRLPVLAPAAAVALLGRPGDDLDELATLCGHLPLALRIAAGRLTRTPAAALVTTLRAGTLSDLARQRSGFDTSFAALPETASRTFRLLGLVPGPTFTPHAVAALADLPARAASAVLDRLASANMVEPAGPGRFAFLDLLRRYATELAPLDPEPRRRLADHYLATAMHAAGLVGPTMALAPGPPVNAAPLPLPDHDAALTWLDTERANLVASVGLAPGGWRLVDALRGYLSMRQPRAEWAHAVSAGHASAVAEGTPAGQAAMHVSLGHLAWCDGRYRESRRHYRTARRWSRLAGWRDGESTALLGMADLHLRQGEAASASLWAREAVTVAREHDLRVREGQALTVLAAAATALGHRDEAVLHASLALATHRRAGHHAGVAQAELLLREAQTDAG
jgi:DNA-binding SARP family transcriptional activator